MESNVVIFAINSSTRDLIYSIRSFKAAGVTNIMMLDSAKYGFVPVLDSSVKLFHTEDALLEELSKIDGFVYFTRRFEAPKDFVSTVFKDERRKDEAYGFAGYRLLKRVNDRIPSVEVEWWNRKPNSTRYSKNDFGDMEVDYFTETGFLVHASVAKELCKQGIVRVLDNNVRATSAFKETGMRLVCMDTPWGRPVRITARNTGNKYLEPDEMAAIKKETKNIVYDENTSGRLDHDVKPSAKGKIIVGLASYHAREQGMLSVVQAIHSQCDTMFVSLNGYDDSEVERIRNLVNVDNVVFTGYCSDEDLGCQNKFRGLKACGPDDYFLTVDDDVVYPKNYVKTMIDHCDHFNGTAVVSCSGMVMNVDERGRSDFTCKRYLSLPSEQNDYTRVHSVGNASSCLVPRRIGLSFSVFQWPKNTGDDEILSLFAKKSGIPLYVVPKEKEWVSFISYMRLVNPLNAGKSPSIGLEKRRRILSLVDDWSFDRTDSAAGSFLFHIVTPMFNDAEKLARCLASVGRQTIDKSSIHMTVVDDASDEDESKAAEAECRKYEFVSFVRNTERKMAGGARNTALDLGIKSEYTMFLDSDDVLKEDNVLEKLANEIDERGRPDVMLCGFRFSATGRTRMFSSSSPAEMAAEQAIAPWTRVTKTEKVCRFVENRRCANDVVQFLRQVDCIDTVGHTSFPMIEYMDDNVHSVWHNKRQKKSRDAMKALCLVVPDILSENFSKPYTVSRAITQIKTDIKSVATFMSEAGREDFSWWTK